MYILDLTLDLLIMVGVGPFSINSVPSSQHSRQ